MQIAVIFVLTLIIHAVNTSAYAARMAGVRTGRLVLATSLFNVLALGSRGANALAAPLIASMTDMTVVTQDMSSLLLDYRIMLAAASVGTLLAGLFIPSLSRILATGVSSYERRKSLPRVIVQGISLEGGRRMWQDLVPPRMQTVRQSRRSPFPKRFLVVMVLITSLYTVSQFAALYASALVPDGARTAASLSPILGGVGVILTILIVDPITALATDEALRGQRPMKDVTYITVWQVGARLVGTVLAQALLWPAGWVLASVTSWLVG